MTAREYVEKVAEKYGERDVTFIIARAVEDEYSPFYHMEYRTTSVCRTESLLRLPESLLLDEHIVINADHPPVDITNAWLGLYKRGYLSCAMLTTGADLKRMYGEEQGLRMIDYYNREITL